jgi:predicted phosphodiesterase
MRLLIVGDIHGNTEFLRDQLYPAAAGLGVAAIVQLGDFGYWEHDPEDRFVDEVADAAAHFDIPLYWLHGNHDNWAWAMQRYGQQRTADGFVSLRPRVNYIPNGFAWSWAGVRFRAFGGAYSLDKPGRLRDERRFNLSPATLWFPWEEMTEDEFTLLMAADSGPKDVVFSHDKPRSANPGIRLKDKVECHPNQDRLQRALLAHQPDLWLHGHLHHRYSCMVRNGDQDGWTEVIGLSCDPQGAGRFWKPTDAWGVLDFDQDVPVTYTPAQTAQDWYQRVPMVRKKAA